MNKANAEKNLTFAVSSCFYSAKKMQAIEGNNEDKEEFLVSKKEEYEKDIETCEQSMLDISVPKMEEYGDTGEYIKAVESYLEELKKIEAGKAKEIYFSEKSKEELLEQEKERFEKDFAAYAGLAKNAESAEEVENIFEKLADEVYSQKNAGKAKTSELASAHGNDFKINASLSTEEKHVEVNNAGNIRKLKSLSIKELAEQGYKNPYALHSALPHFKDLAEGTYKEIKEKTGLGYDAIGSYRNALIANKLIKSRAKKRLNIPKVKEKFLEMLREVPDITSGEVTTTKFYSFFIREYKCNLANAKRDAGVDEKYIRIYKSGNAAEKEKIYEFIKNSDKPLTYEEIAEQFGYSIGSVNRAVKRMKRDKEYKNSIFSASLRGSHAKKNFNLTDLFGELAKDGKYRVLDIKNRKQLDCLTDEIISGIKTNEITKGKKIAITCYIKGTKLPDYVKNRVLGKLRDIKTE